MATGQGSLNDVRVRSRTTEPGTMLLLMTIALAGEPVRIEAGPPVGPAALTVDWSFLDGGCIVNARLSNSGPLPLEVDWTRSVLSEPGIAAEQLVPGTSSAFSVKVNIPPTVIPAAGFADVHLFRLGALPADVDAARPGCFTAAFGSATVTLSVNGEWWSQSLTGLEAIGREVRRREEAEADARVAAAARFAQQQRQRALAACEERAEHQDRQGRDWMFLGGIGLVGGAALTTGGGIVAGLTPYQETEDSAVGIMSLGLLGLAAGVTADIIGWKQHHDAREIEDECGINRKD